MERRLGWVARFALLVLAVVTVAAFGADGNRSAAKTLREAQYAVSAARDDCGALSVNC